MSAMSKCFFTNPPHSSVFLSTRAHCNNETLCSQLIQWNLECNGGQLDAVLECTMSYDRDGVWQREETK